MAATILLAAVLALQGSATASDVRAAVWAALQPALPFPAATDRNEPVDGSETARWVVRRAAGDEAPLVAEVLANPLNREAQVAAVKDMEAIQREVLGAERRAQAELDRAMSDVRERGGSRQIHGVTLDDEGVAGERADAESTLAVEVDDVMDEDAATITAAEPPAVTERPGAFLVRVPARTVEAEGPDGRAHYYPAEARLYFTASAPSVVPAAAGTFIVRVVPPAGGLTVVVVRGNQALVEQVLERADWSLLASRR